MLNLKEHHTCRKRLDTSLSLSEDNSSNSQLMDQKTLIHSKMELTGQLEVIRIVLVHLSEVLW